MLKRPPQHAADSTPLYISPSDDAIDTDRIAREKDETAKEAEPPEHCTDAYWRGSTRYDLDASHTVGGRVVKMRDYLKEGATPTVFRLRRVEPLIRQQAMSVIFAKNDPNSSVGPTELVSSLFDLARLGVAEVTEGFGGKPWDLEGGEGLPLTGKDMRTLYDIGAHLPEALGWAVWHASRPLSEAEGKA